MVTEKEQSCIFMYSNFTSNIVVFISGGQMCLRKFIIYLKSGIFSQQTDINKLLVLVTFYLRVFVFGFFFTKSRHNR